MGQKISNDFLIQIEVGQEIQRKKEKKHNAWDQSWREPILRSILQVKLKVAWPEVKMLKIFRSDGSKTDESTFKDVNPEYDYDTMDNWAKITDLNQN